MCGSRQNAGATMHHREGLWLVFFDKRNDNVSTYTLVLSLNDIHAALHKPQLHCMPSHKCRSLFLAPRYTIRFNFILYSSLLCLREYVILVCGTRCTNIVINSKETHENHKTNSAGTSLLRITSTVLLRRIVLWCFLTLFRESSFAGFFHEFFCRDTIDEFPDTWFLGILEPCSNVGGCSTPL